MPADPTPAVLSPERILMHTLPAVVGAHVLATAVDCSLFTHLENGAGSASALAGGTGVSERGAQALLDGLTAIGLVESTGGGYRNSADASAFLVEGRPGYLGEFARMILSQADPFGRLPEAVRSGSPVATDDLATVDHPRWRELVMAIVPLAMPLAQRVAERLVRGRGAASILDIGGGSGVYSNIAHQESPDENVAVLRRIRRALRPGGTLVISDFVLDAGGRGHPFAGLFSSVMLLSTQSGASWRMPDYDRWLAGAGFTEVRFEATPSPSTLIFAS